MSRRLGRDYSQSPIVLGETMAFPPEELCAAYLADPRRSPPTELPWALCDMQRLLQVLRKNKVPLLSLADRPQLQSDPLFQAACQAEADTLAGLRAEYKLAHQALAAHGIVGVLIKSVGMEPSLPFKSDNLDVLYKPGDVEQVRSTLYQLGYIELTNVEEPHKYLFRKFHAGRSVSAIHVHAHVGWMTSFLDEEKLWQRCRPAADEDWVTIPAPEDALLTTLAHWFYEDKRLVLQDVVKCAHCLRQGVDWDEIYRIAIWRGWRDGLNVSLLLCSYQETVLYGQTLVPSPILEGAWRGIPGWAQKVLERHPGAHASSALRQERWNGTQAIAPFGPRGAARRDDWYSPVGSPLPRGKDQGSPPGANGAPRSRYSALRFLQSLRGTAFGETPARKAVTTLPIPFLFSKAFSYAKLWRDPSRSTARKVKDLVLHTAYGTKLRLHIHSQPAMLVTLSGVDGCGKTTQARALQSAFETCHLRVNYTWSRGGSAGWIAFLNRWLRHRTDVAQAQKTEAKVQARQQQLHSPWKRWAWSWLTASELLLQYTFRVSLPLLWGRVVICDRYVYDALADWSAYFGEQAVEKRMAARVLRALTPRPSRAYWLDVPAEVAQSRSPDGLPVHFLDTQSATYRRWADPSSTSILIPASGAGRPACLPSPHALQRLDGSQGWEEISDQVVYDVLSAYFSDYWTWVNSLFWKNPGQWR